MLHRSSTHSLQRARCHVARAYIHNMPDVGNVFTQLHTGFTEDQVKSWTILTGDSNPIHTSMVAAGQAGFPDRVLPGMLCASLFPAIIGSEFPGALYLTQTLKFRQTALIGQALEAKVAVAKMKGRHITFDTVCRRASDQAVIVDGTLSSCMLLELQCRYAWRCIYTKVNLSKVDHCLEQLRPYSCSQRAQLEVYNRIPLITLPASACLCLNSWPPAQLPAQLSGTTTLYLTKTANNSPTTTMHLCWGLCGIASRYICFKLPQGRIYDLCNCILSSMAMSRLCYVVRICVHNVIFDLRGTIAQ